MWSDVQFDARFLLIDDREANVALLRELLAQAGYRHMVGTTDPREAIGLFEASRPDIILLDLMMPHRDGYDVLRQLRARMAAGEYLPVLVLTASTDPEAKQRALAEGAQDFLTKPFDTIEVLLRIRNLLQTRRLHRQLRVQNELLEKAVLDRTRDLEDARVEILARLALAAEFRDDDTGQHTVRVGELSARLAAHLRRPDGEIDLIRRAAPLHDIGKIGIPDTILLKPGMLTLEEFEVMKTHTTIGAQILSGSRSQMLQTAGIIALTHHERWNGQGYPEGLQADRIPTVSRIVAVADAYDALTNDRPYRRAIPEVRARAILRDGGGVEWDGQVVAALDALAAAGRLSELAPPVPPAARPRSGRPAATLDVRA